jgi:hypothetical protein
MKENKEEITYETLEAFLEEMASATVKPVPMEKTGEMTLRTNIENAKKEIQRYRELISATKSKILSWEIELERIKRRY